MCIDGINVEINLLTYLLDIDYTFESPSGATSFIDYFIVSSNVFDNISSYTVLHDMFD